jgi:hypothetical protein
LPALWSETRINIETRKTFPMVQISLLALAFVASASYALSSDRDLALELCPQSGAMLGFTASWNLVD